VLFFRKIIKNAFRLAQLKLLNISDTAPALMKPPITAAGQ
jgi:hypothetical protein